jgi:hypothetical protein
MVIEMPIVGLALNPKMFNTLQEITYALRALASHIDLKSTNLMP